MEEKLRTVCPERIEAERAAGALAAPSAAVLERLLDGGEASVASVLALLTMAKRGLNSNEGPIVDTSMYARAPHRADEELKKMGALLRR